MDTEEDDGCGRQRERVAAVDAAYPCAAHGVAPPEAPGWPAAHQPPPAVLRERLLPSAVGTRVRRRPRQALLLLPAVRFPIVITKMYLVTDETIICSNLL